MTRSFSTLLLAAWPGLALDFNRNVRPILSDRCFSCHGPDTASRQAGLRLDQEESAKAALRGKRPIVPGDPEGSEVYRRIASDNKAQRMPPAYAGHEKLSAAEIGVLRRWIAEGAPWQGHWAFLAPVRPNIPPLKNTAWVRSPIDAYVLNKLEREGLSPSPEAPKDTLLRRVTLDLTGLPPTPAQVNAFVNDASPDAYEKVVDRLLASPRYAERMAIRWLEAARYADTNGYQSDGQRDMYRWRDWVIDAFHRNMPFDRFTIEQIAGDLLPNATLDQKIASAFHRNHRTNAEGGIVEEEFRVEYVADRVETTATVWLGLTMGCARCHDHKYDPFTQKDFYRLFASFNNVPERGLVYNFGNEEPFLKAPTPEHTRKLAELDRRVREAGQRWASLQDRLDKEQARWEKGLRKAGELEWTISGGRVLHLPLGEARFDGERVVEAGYDVAKFDYQDPFTLAAWIKPESPNGAIVSRAEDYFEGEGYTWFLMDGKLRLHITRRFTDISLRIETVKPILLNQWQHVGVTYDGYRKGAGVKMYVNGERQELKILFDELTYPYAPKEPFRVGAGAGPKHRFRGLIEDVRAYNIALSPEQVSVLPLPETVTELARIPANARSKPQAGKLRFCFLDRFASEEIRSALRDLEQARKERKKYFESIPTVMVMAENATPRDTFVLKRGAYDQPGEKVMPAVPAVLPQLKREWPDNRLGLARWLVDRSNPLTARVTVNRFWQMLFGTGLVKTAEDFGSQGEWPLQADLLDWLAVEFMDSGWNVKGILKTIVTSSTYRQSSRLTPELLAKDPENRLLARGPRLRLSAEMIRDQALAISGLLVEKVGGPSVKPYQPPGLWQELAGGSGYKQDKGEGLYRRSLYTYWKRTVAPPAMITFDSPTRENCIVRETRTNTPLQALNLMNDVTYLEASRKLAERMMIEGGGDPGERIRYAFRLALAREPREREAQVLGRVWEQLRSRYRRDRDAAVKYLSPGESARDESLDPSELAAYASVASLILNLDETVTKE
ncbi:MAG: DUF1553 domain-containing protein [Acidobacteria bacterium]|nr:DUF1553 domain-containing protein [Acidobacteriota bacterium]